MVNYRIGIDGLYERLAVWNGYVHRKVRLIACGGTALTLLGFKESTKDIDLMVPDGREYNYLIGILQKLGYKQVRGNSWKLDSDGLFIFDIYPGNLIHTTEILESPLMKGNHMLVKELSHIYLGVLNDYDLVTSKLLRGTAVDFDDCQALVDGRRGALDLDRLTERFKETARCSIGGDRLGKNLDYFLDRIGRTLRNGT